jgi:hypothetical protein
MRITGLLVLLLFILIFFAAPAASYAQNATADQTAASAPATFDRALRDVERGDSVQLERDGVCFTMRTYKVAREDKGSDVTYPVRVTRCLPSSKMEFKSAVAPVRRVDEQREQR